jgi:Bifunctional DNA primase/polymerase, N-terminal
MSVVRKDSQNLRVALNWAAAGAYVFPAGPDKKPRVKWRDVSSIDPDQIKSWFAQMIDALPAIDLAKSGHVVLDGDRHGGPDGVAAAEELFAERALKSCRNSHNDHSTGRPALPVQAADRGETAWKF